VEDKEIAGATATESYRRFTSMACFHCGDLTSTDPDRQTSPCVKACPTGAAYKRNGKNANGDPDGSPNDGVVLFRQKKQDGSNWCIGCRRCEWVCPYGAPQYNSNTGQVEKCTFCAHRIEAGWTTGNVACAATCIGQALKGYADINNNSTFTDGADSTESRDGDGLPSSTISYPNVLWTTSGKKA
jgi:Fe-S-cluster-containing dehydrogenase component